MKTIRSIVCLFALSSIVAFVACKDEPDAKTMANQESVQEDAPVEALFKAKVRRVVGGADIMRKANASWKTLRYGQSVYEHNRIRTGMESDAVLNASDGSVLWISENSDVTLEGDMIDSLNKKISILVSNGQVMFDVQKQPSKQSMVFKTATATIAIRGTAGFVGDVAGKTVASLKEGKVEVTDQNGTTSTIVNNQTIVVDKKGATKLDLQASGTMALSKNLDSLLQNIPPEAVAQELEAVLKKFDAGYKERLASFESQLKFISSALPETVYVPSVTLQARVNPGVIVTVLGEADTVGENGVYQHTFDWADDSYGQKRFLASCSDGDVEVPCFMWTTMYAAPEAAAAPEEPAQEEVAAAPAKTAKVEEKPADAGRDLNLKVAFAGPRTEKKHLDLPAAEYTANMKVNLSGITAGDLNEIKSIVLKRGGKVVETVPANEITSMSYEFSAKIPRNIIANFEVDVTLKNGKTYKAKKTYEVYCMVANHPGGKARNSILPPDQEYAKVKEQGLLKEE